MLPLLLALGSPAFGGEFMDTWITLALEDTNIRAGPQNYSPAANFVQRGNRTFFEDYESRYSDDITQSHLVLYRRDPGFWKDWFTEAAFVVQFTPYLEPDQARDGVAIEDDGSYVRLARRFDGDDDHTVSLTGYAVDASRFRLGYSYDLSWGGREIFAGDPYASPGVRLQYERHGSYLFAGAKTAIFDEVQTEGEWQGYQRNQAFYGFLFGGGLEVGERFRVEAGMGSFRQGQLVNVNDIESPLFGDPIQAVGLAGQLSFRTSRTLAFIQSADLRLYRNTPEFLKDPRLLHRVIDGVGFLVQTEVNWLAHDLLDSQEPGATVVEQGLAGDVQTVLVIGSTELGVDLVYKDLAYILFNVPGFTSDFAIPDIAYRPQVYARFQASHTFAEAHVAPSVGIGLMQPASYTTSSGTFVQYSETDKEEVPGGQTAANILGGVAGVQVDVSPSVVLLGEALLTIDNNRSDAVSTSSGDAVVRVPADAVERHPIGFNLMMRARF
ncbi:MAG: hypothetical protein JXB39_01195 [Deltaproteobacteria bacterium]|nr:hypothetical protein [Deltaproteobacteria bacterium]